MVYLKVVIISFNQSSVELWRGNRKPQKKGHILVELSLPGSSLEAFGRKPTTIKYLQNDSSNASDILAIHKIAP